MLNEQSAGKSLVELATGYVLSKAIFASVELDVAQHLGEGVMQLDELASAANADAGSLQRLLGFLISHGLFSVNAEGRYQNNARSQLLRPDVDGSLAHFIRLICDEQYLAFDGLVTSVRTGNPVFAEYFGSDFFTHLSEDHQMKSKFHKAMGVNKQDEIIAREMAAKIPKGAHVVDVGGGNGSLAFSILRSVSGVTVEVFDRPEHVESTRQLIEDNGLGHVCHVSGGDFFRGVPRGQIMMLKRILHNWASHEIIKLLTNCRHSLDQGGRIFIIERLLSDSGNHNQFARFSDLSMLVLHTGRERYAYEYEKLLAAGGFELIAVHQFGIDMVIIEAK